MLVEIVTPEGTLISKEVESVVIPAEAGETGILPGHIPLITKINRGELKLVESTGTDLIAVDRGYAEIIGDRVAILTEGAIDIEDIDLGTIEEAQKRATEALEEAKAKDLDPAEVEALETRMQFLLTQKLIKEGRR